VYYVFDVLVLAGKDVMRERLNARRALLEKFVLPLLDEPIRYSQELPASLSDLIEAVKEEHVLDARMVSLACGGHPQIRHMHLKLL
jgi:ATP-dependent DNA ligase